jgi:hypothetical protein
LCSLPAWLEAFRLAFCSANLTPHMIGTGVARHGARVCRRCIRWRIINAQPCTANSSHDSNWTWLVTECAVQDHDFLSFGYVIGLEEEWGYVSLSEVNPCAVLFLMGPASMKP